jgi:hypothetical protein
MRPRCPSQTGEYCIRPERMRQVRKQRGAMASSSATTTPPEARGCRVAQCMAVLPCQVLGDGHD